MMKYTIKTKDHGDIECQSYTLMTNKGIMYCFEDTLTKDTKEVGYVADEQLQVVVLNTPTKAETPAIQFEPTIGQA